MFYDNSKKIICINSLRDPFVIGQLLHNHLSDPIDHTVAAKSFLPSEAVDAAWT